VTSGPVSGMDASCAHCGSAVRSNAHYCNACGKAISGRPTPTKPVVTTTAIAAQPVSPSASPVTVDHIVPAGREVRSCSFLLDLAVMLSPALPLTMVAAIVGVSRVVYVVVPTAIVAVWIWMQLWQGYTGMTFGKSVLGLRLIQDADQRAPGFAAGAARSLVFAATAGLAALGGAHDRLTGLALIDIARGSNPLGARQQPALRRTLDRGLKNVGSPVPLTAAGRR
jgi:RDD family